MRNVTKDRITDVSWPTWLRTPIPGRAPCLLIEFDLPLLREGGWTVAKSSTNPARNAPVRR